MKKDFFVVVVTILLLSLFSCGTTSPSSKNSPDWAGIYTSTGIVVFDGDNYVERANGRARVTLNADETYTEEYQYIHHIGQI